MAPSTQPLLDRPRAASASGSPPRRRKATLCIVATVSIAAVVLPLATLAALAATTATHFRICDELSPVPASCRAALSGVATLRLLPPTKLQLLGSLLRFSLPHIDAAARIASEDIVRVNGPATEAGLADCATLMDLSRSRVEDSAAAVDQLSYSSVPSAESLSDIRTWLSAVLTNHVTCSDGLVGAAGSALEGQLSRLMGLASASLAVVASISPRSAAEEELDLLSSTGEFPSWISASDRRLLQATFKVTDATANAVVALDGSGNFKTVKEAVESAPEGGKKRYVIRVKEGKYKENVEIGKKKKKLTIIGDGMDKTIITGSLNVVDGSTTFNSATLAAVGDEIIIRDICIENTAGAEKHQAVALRVGADKAVIYRCRIQGYQDTLYAHSLRQFYRECLISGTVDFIFGNAAVVLQKCDLSAKRPMNKQKNIVTAQGRTDPNQNTGTSIQQCRVVPSSDLSPVKSSFPTYLGRPWKLYSRTVFMQSYLDDLVSPPGWLEWDGDFALSTLYYGEYMNNGPGAGTQKRVKWAGYRVIKSANEASKFTVAQLIQGGEWLKGTGVAYSEGL